MASPSAERVSRSPVTLQAKLTVGATNDPLEREADDIADRVVRTSDAASSLLQRCPGGCPGEEELRPEFTLQRCPGGRPGDETAWRRPLPTEQRSRATGVDRPRVSAAGERAIDSHRGGGAPLPSSLRGFFEPRFGARFGNVRLHTDTDAGRLSADVSARAFTVGSDIFFGGGEYRPGSTAGRRLLAHELAHTVQQFGDCHMQRQAAETPPIIDEPPTIEEGTFPTAAEVFEAYQDEPAALGRELHRLVSESLANVGVVLEVLDMVGWLSRDDVAYYFLSGHDLSAITSDIQGRALLARLRTEIAGGAPMPSEKAEIRRIDEALEATTQSPDHIFPIDLSAPAFPSDLGPADLEGEETAQLYAMLVTAWSSLESDPSLTHQLLTSIEGAVEGMRPLIECVSGSGDDSAETDLAELVTEVGYAIERLTEQADHSFETMRQNFEFIANALVGLDPAMEGLERTGSVGSCATVVLGPFAEGVIAGLATIDPAQAKRFSASITNNPFFGPGFSLGAAAGILIDAKGVVFNALAVVRHPLTAGTDILRDLREAMEKFGDLVDELTGPTGGDVAEQIGRGVGSQFCAQLTEVNKANGPFMFAFELGKVAGPSIVYAVLSLLGFEEFVAGRLLLLAGDSLKSLKGFSGLKSVFRIVDDLPAVPTRNMDVPKSQTRLDVEGGPTIRSGVDVGEGPMGVAPRAAANLDPADQSFLDKTASLTAKDFGPSDVDRELDIAQRVGIRSERAGSVIYDLPNGHRWELFPDGTMCRSSTLEHCRLFLSFPLEDHLVDILNPEFKTRFNVQPDQAQRLRNIRNELADLNNRIKRQQIDVDKALVRYHELADQVKQVRPVTLDELADPVDLVARMKQLEERGTIAGTGEVTIVGRPSHGHEAPQAVSFGRIEGGGTVDFTIPSGQGIEGFFSPASGAAPVPVSLKDWSYTGQMRGLVAKLDENRQKILAVHQRGVYLHARVHEWKLQDVSTYIRGGRIITMPSEGVFEKLIFECSDGILEVTKSGVREL